jgi:hypothetical protein
VRLLHPTTIKILASHPEFPKTHLANCWSEIFKWKASGQQHPKQFLYNDKNLGRYMAFLARHAISAGCKLDVTKIKNLGPSVSSAFITGNIIFNWDEQEFNNHFDSDYLFSDACSLYYKNINIFPDIFGYEWEKYCPVISHKEILRQVTKTLSKK